MELRVTRTDYAPLAVPNATVGLVRLAPDRRRVAYTCAHDGRTSIWVSDAVRVAPDRPEGKLAPTAAAQAGALELVDCGPAAVADLGFSPDGAWLGYRVAGEPPGFGDRIGWASTTAAGELGRRPGLAFAWAPGRPALYVADAEGYQLRRLDVTSGRSRELAELIHFPDPHFWPHIAPSPDGQRVAFTARHEPHDANRIWYVQAREGTPEAVFVTRVPGADVHVLPFWSPRGVSLAMHLVHVELDRTGLVVLRQLQGEGELLYVHEASDGAITPAWAPGGRAIALYRRRDALDAAAAGLDGGADPTTTTGLGSPADPMPDQQLSWLDLATRELVPLAGRGELAGEPRFLDDSHLLVDGGAAAHVLQIERV